MGPRFIVLLLVNTLLLADGAQQQERPAEEQQFPEPLSIKPGFCSDECYARATCNEALGGRCDCPKHLAGTDCDHRVNAGHLAAFTQSPTWEARNPMPCLNNCTQHGNCTMGACVCNRGFFTSDCSMSWDHTAQGGGRPVLLAHTGYKPRQRRPRIYVYDIPHKYSSWYNPLRLDRSVSWVFWQRLLGSGVLVADGEEADWFFIPAKLRSTTDGFRLLEAVEYVRTQWPWYNRYQGQRHFVLHTGDTGRGEVPGRVREATANLTWLHHWGLTEDWPTSGWKAAHRPGKDIVVPIYFGVGKGHQHVSESGLHPRAPRLARNKTLLFAGRICGDYSKPDRERAWPHCATNRSSGYSQGVRQMVHYYHHNRTRYKLTVQNKKYQLDMLKYQWCLAPSGGGHGHRQTLVALMGCLPLVISDSVMQPFEPEMDWNRFGLRVAHADIPNLHELLDAVGEEELQRRRDALLCASQHLMFSSMSGAIMQEDGRWDAFEFTLEILRMQQKYPDLDPKLYGEKDEEFRSFLNCGESDMETYGRKLREAHQQKYPQPLQPLPPSEGVGSGVKEVTWQYLYKYGVTELLGRASLPDPALEKEPLRLCSMSKWDEEKARCQLHRGGVLVYPPGGAACEGYGADLGSCPRLWT